MPIIVHLSIIATPSQSLGHRKYCRICSTTVSGKKRMQPFTELGDSIDQEVLSIEVWPKLRDEQHNNALGPK